MIIYNYGIMKIHRMHIGIVILLSFYFNSCSMNEDNKYLGNYTLDVNSSKLGKFGGVDSVLDLKLTLKKDYTFHFSKSVPFIFKENGTWEIKRVSGIDIPSSTRCYFNYGGNNREDVLLPMDEECNKVYFEYPLPKGTQEDQVPFLCFRKI